MIPVEDKAKALREALTALGILLAMALFSWFIWPTRYEHGERRIGQTVYPMRIHRLSRRVEILSTFGWELVSATPEPEPTEIPPSELAKIMLNCSTTPFGILECDVFNNSDWTLSEITLTVRILNRNGTVARTRQYGMTPDSLLHFNPGDSTRGLVRLDFPIQPGQTWDWMFAGAKGVGPH